MRIAIVQAWADPDPAAGPYRFEVAYLAAVLLRHRREVRLAVCRAADDTALGTALAEPRPDTVLVYAESFAADLAMRLTEAIRGRLDVPLILFGPHATLCPNECLSRPGVEAVAIGPADRSIPAYLAAPPADPARLQSPGMWVNCASGVMRNPPAAPPRSLRHMPRPARHLYGSADLLDASGFAEVCVARGGEGILAPADQAEAEAPAMPGAPGAARPWPVLHRPVGEVIDEMVAAHGMHLDLVGYRLANDRLAAGEHWVEGFATRYAEEVALPLRASVAARDVTPRVARALSLAGCEQARIDVGSGSAMIRQDILGIQTPEAVFEAAFRALRQAGVPTVARVEVGAAYETSVTLDQTVELLQQLDPDRVEAELHYPAPGTAAHAAAREAGVLVSDPAAARRAGRPALDLPGLEPEALLSAREWIPYAVHQPRTAALIRAARRVRLGRGRTFYDLAVKPFLGPAVRPGLTA